MVGGRANRWIVGDILLVGVSGIVNPISLVRADAEAIVAAFLPELKADERSREVLHLLLHQPAPSLALVPFQTLTMNAAIELLPDWARRKHGLPAPTLTKPAIRIGTRGIAETVRWALRD